MYGRIRGMLIKEFIQVFRDKRTRFLLFGPPVIQMLVFGYAATLEIRHIPTAVLDFDNSQVSRDLLSRFTASPYFDVRARLHDRRQIGDLIDRGTVTVALQINAGFAQDLRKGQTAHLQVIVDSSNSNTALIAVGYVNQIAGRFSQDYQKERVLETAPLVQSQLPSIVLDRRPWFNTDLDSQWFFVPGVIGNLILVMVVSLTAFAVVREREIGTLEQIMVTPIGRLGIHPGKDGAVFSDRSARYDPHLLDRHPVVRCAVPREHRGPGDRSYAVHPVHAWALVSSSRPFRRLSNKRWSPGSSSTCLPSPFLALARRSAVCLSSCNG